MAFFPRQSLSIGLLAIATLAKPALGAEQITFHYWGLEQSVTVASLETYVREGVIPPDLRPLTRRLGPTGTQTLRQVLTVPTNLGVVAVAQLLYSPSGERFLAQLAQVVQSESDQAGFLALRAAFVLAAADGEGLTLLNVLKQFPLPVIRLNVPEGLQLFNELQALMASTEDAIAAIQVQAKLETVQDTPSQALALATLQQPGPFSWDKRTLKFRDSGRRNRPLAVVLHVPLLESSPWLQPAPVIVISHGLWASPIAFTYLAEHLTSHGFAVVLLEHPGSSDRQLTALFRGQTDKIIEPKEFVDRPLDITFLLDSLGEWVRGEPDLRGQINLDQVGIIGQSLGGYTALAMAGAPLNLRRLAVDCGDNLNVFLNLSLLLQCRALHGVDQNTVLRDQRIKGAIALNPITSHLFGAKGIGEIQVPVLMLAGSLDTVASALLEQIQPFTWLTTPDKYLVLLEGATHFSVLGESLPGSNPLPLRPQIIGPDPISARNYVKALSLAFVQTHIVQGRPPETVLQGAIAQARGQDTMGLYLVHSLNPVQLLAPAHSPPRPEKSLKSLP